MIDIVAIDEREGVPVLRAEQETASNYAAVSVALQTGGTNVVNMLCVERCVGMPVFQYERQYADAA